MPVVITTASSIKNETVGAATSRRGVSAAKPHARCFNAHTMQRGFVCCNGPLGGW